MATLASWSVPPLRMLMLPMPSAEYEFLARRAGHGGQADRPLVDVGRPAVCVAGSKRADALLNTSVPGPVLVNPIAWVYP